MEPVGNKEEMPLLARRLCNEIKLFDLCDLISCKEMDGLFCTKEELLRSFEKIEEDESVQYLVDDSGECDESDDFDCDDIEADELAEDEGSWED